jgi:hypothetical protein
LTKELTESSREDIANERGAIYVCAASGPEAQWEQINWSQCELKVRRLQERIVKATQKGRHGKVKALLPGTKRSELH